MTVAELIARLRKLNPDALVVRHADMCGYDECDAILKVVMLKRRPQSEAMNGRGRWVDAGTKPKSRGRRHDGVAVV